MALDALMVPAMVALVGACCYRPDHLLRPLLANSVVRYVGTISYGIYLLHMLALNFCKKTDRVSRHRVSGSGDRDQHLAGQRELLAVRAAIPESSNRAFHHPGSQRADQARIAADFRITVPIDQDI